MCKQFCTLSELYFSYLRIEKTSKNKKNFLVLAFFVQLLTQVKHKFHRLGRNGTSLRCSYARVTNESKHFGPPQSCIPLIQKLENFEKSHFPFISASWVDFHQGRKLPSWY